MSTFESMTPMNVDMAKPQNVIGYTFEAVSGPYILAAKVGKIE